MRRDGAEEVVVGEFEHDAERGCGDQANRGVSDRAELAAGGVLVRTR